MATAAAEDAAPKGGGKKKLIIIIVAVVVVLATAAVGALLLLKKKAPAEGEDAAAAESSHHAAPKKDHGAPPAYVPLDPFTVNLADREVDRFAQIGITLEVEDAKFGEQVKTFLPAIRSNILMLLAHKTSAELMTREGKERLALEVKRESLRPMGIEIDIDEGDGHGDEAPAKGKKKAPVHSPITNVLFSSFIVQ